MASINEVAKKAGVAVSTVSKVLNNYPNVSKTTKEAVMKAVEELNYAPNLIASTLSSKNTRRVALIIFINNQKQAIDEINMQYLFGAFEEAKKLRLEIMPIFSNVFENMNKDEIVRYLRSQSFNGIIIYGLSKHAKPWLDIIHEQLFHAVVVDAPLYNDKTSSVMVDHAAGQYDVAKKTILECDCHNVLYIAGGREGFVTEMRLNGIMQLRDEMGFDLEIEYCNFSEKKAYEAVMKNPNFDVIVCASDLMAIGAVSALKKLDIFHLVCGYDGITLLGYIPYQINTVKQDFFKVSKIALEEMSKLLDGETGHPTLVNYELTHITYDDVIM